MLQMTSRVAERHRATYRRCPLAGFSRPAAAWPDWFSETASLEEPRPAVTAWLIDFAMLHDRISLVHRLQVKLPVNASLHPEYRAPLEGYIGIVLVAGRHGCVSGSSPENG